MNLKHIIIQAGGKGTRLEQLTRNKPKCLVPYDNLPIIFHLFEKFKGAKFTVISDYKSEVLQRYLGIFANAYDYKIIKAKEEGTMAGIKEAMSKIKDDEPFMLIWCDLILSKAFTLPILSPANNSIPPPQSNIS